MLRLLSALVLMLSPVPALAQALSCSVPGQTPRPQFEGPTKKEPRRALPIGSYTLALTWSPQHCSMIYSAFSGKDAFQCSGKSGQFGFTLHGLWPDGVGKEWPQYCKPADLLPRAVVAKNLCTTPSVQLLQHEWAKHGTCMASKPDLYFDLSRAFYQSIRYPDMRKLAAQQDLTVGDFVAAFVKVNKALKPDMVRVRTTRSQWLDELWLCMDRQMEFTRCPAHQGGAPDSATLRIEPGPDMPIQAAAKRPAPKPVTQPRRKPGLVLDLDPNVQPLTNSSDKK
jgi:ribonuclease T2